MSIRHVTLVGAGVLGAQIAFQTAFKGFDVSAYVPDQAALDKAGTCEAEGPKTGAAMAPQRGSLT